MVFTADYITGLADYPKSLSKYIYELARPRPVAKDIFDEIVVGGKSFVVLKQKGSVGVGVSAIKDGASAPINFTELTTVSFDPDVYESKLKITREAIMDANAQVGLLQFQLRNLAFEAAWAMDKAALDAIDSAANQTFAATGSSVFFDGTSTTVVSGGLGQKDIVKAIRMIKEKNYQPTHLLIHPLQEEDLSLLPHFTRYMDYGDGDTTLRNGKLGTIYGLEVRVSNMVSAGTAYVIGKEPLLRDTYTPFGFWVVKEPLQTKVEEDGFDYVLRLRFRQGAMVLNGDAIVKITGLRTS